MYYTTQQLRDLRNNIPIHNLIAKLLPTKWIEGRFRVLCPRCNEMAHTKVLQNNTLMCFACKKYWNTIELLMECKQISFIDAVSKLRQRRNALKSAKKKTGPVLIANEDMRDLVNKVLKKAA